MSSSYAKNKFSRTGDSWKWVKRLNDGNNNGQATHGERKHAWRTQAAWAKIIVDTMYFLTP